MNPTAERHLFKLPTGYLHVDEGGIVFTRSGNWEEAAKAQERNGRTNIGQVVRVVLGIALVVVGMALYGAKGLDAGGSMGFFFAAIGAAFGAYKLINKLQDDLARTFRIPWAKVRSVHEADGDLHVTFVNGRWKEDKARVQLAQEERERVMAVWNSRQR